MYGKTHREKVRNTGKHGILSRLECGHPVSTSGYKENKICCWNISIQTCCPCSLGADSLVEVQDLDLPYHLPFFQILCKEKVSDLVKVHLLALLEEFADVLVPNPAR